VTCWGKDDFGQVSDANADGGTSFTQLTAGYEHTCGLRSNGSVTCWGNDANGQVSGPNGDGGTDFIQISSRGDYTCGLRNDGSVICWGDRFIDTRALVVARP